MHSSARRIIVLSLILVLAGTLQGLAQNADFATVDNPYQGEVPFTLGKPSSPMVEIAGIRWSTIRLIPSTTALESGRRIRTVVEVTLENTMRSRAKVLIVLLFEDGDGNGLDRVELKPITVGGGKKKIFKQKIKVQSDVLGAAAKLYLFAEVK
ncbi:MAG: hypothetical protein GXP47_00160 [Acidobacteria bacterium]|nr:hypothetical protein [Acidobacteriota bacterium]